jgi:hypothetical protein
MKTWKLVLLFVAICLGQSVLAQNYCLNFGEDCNDYVTVPYSGQLFFSGPFTVECWFTVHGQLLNDHVPLVSTFPPTAISGTGWLIGLVGSPNPTQINCAYYDYFVSQYANFIPIQDTWNHLAMSWDGQTVRLFINGSLAWSTPATIAYQTNDQPLTIGGQNGSWWNRNLNGKMDEVRLSTTCRYISNFVPATIFNNDPNTVAVYHFNEGSGDILNDASGNGHDGTIYGATWTLGGPQPPAMDVNITPVNPPIVIHANGGWFSYNLNVHNLTTQPQTFSVWTKIFTQQGLYYNGLGPITRTLPGGANPTRMLTQNVAASIPPGTHYYIAYVGPNATVIQDSSYFTFTKSSTSDGGPWITESTCEGDLFEEYAVDQAPETFTLQSAYPNPFNPTTTIAYTLPAAARVKLSIYDIGGRLLATLVEGYRDAGVQEILFDASGLPSGIYLARLESGSCSQVQKLVLLK